MRIAFIRWLGKTHMLKISLVEKRTRRQVVLEGKLIAPWAAELRAVCEKEKAELDGRELVVEMKCITAISQEGENVLLQLMKEGVKLRSRDVFMKQVLKQVARRARRDV
jgi:hypothetical protein